MESTRGYVGMLDVLGFSQLIARESRAEELSAYVAGVREATAGSGVDSILFSDTIVLTTANDEEASLLALLRACSFVFGKLLESGVPVRGAISHGSFYRYADRESGSVFLAGAPVVDAYRFEKIQDWIGIMLAPSAVRRVPDLRERCVINPRTSTREEYEAIGRRFPWSMYVQPCHMIPFQAPGAFEDSRYDGFGLIPTLRETPSPNAMAACILKAINQLQRLKELAPDPKSQRKYQQSISWLYDLQGHWNVLGREWERFQLEWTWTL